MVVKDAARGIAAGVSEVFPHAEQRDDCFHVLYEMNKARRRLERRAYAAIEREGEALGRLGKIRAHDKVRRRKAKCALRISLEETRSTDFRPGAERPSRSPAPGRVQWRPIGEPPTFA